MSLCLFECKFECSIPSKRGRKWLVHLDLCVLDFLMMMTMTMLKMTRIMMMMCGSRQRQTHLHRKQSLPNIDCTGAALEEGDEEK